MARIVIIQHACENASLKGYSIGLLADVWRRAGHDVVVPVRGQPFPEADLAVLHVNLSVVPQAYSDRAANYRRVVNGGVLDIRKRMVSHRVVTRGDGWEGPVIVKSDLNCNGVPERAIQEYYLVRGHELETPLVEPAPYKVYLKAERLPHEIWDDERYVVERFLPERDGDYYCIRTWLFFGDRERCVRCHSHSPIVKGESIIGYAPAEIPDALRAERERLGFDFGKFDFVLHDGEAILFDANKTPSLPPPSPQVRQLYDYLAEGLDAFLSPARAAT